MRRSDWSPRTSWTLAAIVWLAAGPLMLPLVGAIRCYHTHTMSAAHMARMPTSIPASNPQAPCFCDHMTAGLDGGLLLTPAVPTLLAVAPVAVVRLVRQALTSLSAPLSRISPPTPPPPIGLV